MEKVYLLLLLIVLFSGNLNKDSIDSKFNKNQKFIKECYNKTAYYGNKSPVELILK